MNTNDARQALADAAMRRGLYNFLLTFHPDASDPNFKPIPASDDHILQELRRILPPGGAGRRRRWWWPW